MSEVDAGVCPDEDVFMAAMQGRLDEAERAALDQHIDGCPACAELFIALGQLITPAPPDAEPIEPPEAARDRMVGRYKLVRVVGAGGMGVVWEGHDPQLNRRIAVKLLRPDTTSSPARQARLMQEARALAALSHPHVLTIYDVGEERGQVWLAMEYVQGQPMSSWARARERRWREVLDAYLAVARGLAAAHAAGIVHRDIKPDNILMREDGRAVLTDFGLATPAAPSDAGGSGAGADVSRLTATGAILGTPLYMAPEVLGGGHADERSDQYALCAALYEGLYGARPYSGATLQELVREAQRGELPRPRSSEVPGALYEVLARGLSPRAAERFPDITHLIAALEASARSNSPLRGLLWGAAAVGTLGVGALIVGALASPGEEASEAPPVVAPPPARVEAPAGPPAEMSGAVERARVAQRDARTAAEAQATPRVDASAPAGLTQRAPSPRDKRVRVSAPRDVAPARAAVVAPAEASGQLVVKHGANFPEAERQRAATFTERLRVDWTPRCASALYGAEACDEAVRALEGSLRGQAAQVYLAGLVAQGANPESARITGGLLQAFYVSAVSHAVKQGRCEEAARRHAASMKLWAWSNPQSAFAQQLASDPARVNASFVAQYKNCAP